MKKAEMTSTPTFSKKLQNKFSQFFRKIDLDQAVIFIVVVICEILIWL